MKELVILDLDDTLVDTSDVYWTARSRFITLLSKDGSDSGTILETFEAIDEDNMKLHGFAPERYLFTMQQTYREFARRGEVSTNREIEAEIKKIGKIIWTQVPALIDGARELLDWTGDRFRLCLLSRGIEPVQLKKLEHHGLVRYFERIRIVERKTEREFRQMLADMGADAASAWAIGDSVKSDINPGIEAGIKCILYVYTHHSYHWRQEYGEQAIGAFYKVKTLRDAIDVLRKPSGFTMISTV